MTVSAWPIKVLAIDGRLDRVAKEVDRLLALISTERSPVRRADALRILFGAVVHAKPRVTLRVIEALASAAFQPLQSGRRNRRGESELAICLPAIARIDPGLAEKLLARLPPTQADPAREQMVMMKTASLDQLVSWPHLGDHTA